MLYGGRDQAERLARTRTAAAAAVTGVGKLPALSRVYTYIYRLESKKLFMHLHTV